MTSFLVLFNYCEFNHLAVNMTLFLIISPSVVMNRDITVCKFSSCINLIMRSLHETTHIRSMCCKISMRTRHASVDRYWFRTGILFNVYTRVKCHTLAVGVEQIWNVNRSKKKKNRTPSKLCTEQTDASIDREKSLDAPVRDTRCSI